MKRLRGFGAINKHGRGFQKYMMKSAFFLSKAAIFLFEVPLDFQLGFI